MMMKTSSSALHTISIVASFSILSLFLLYQVTVAQASPETVVKVDPPSSFVGLGETFTVNVTVVDVQNLYGVDVTLYWNSSVVKVLNVDIQTAQTDGVLYSPVWAVTDELSQSQGRYIYAATSYPPASSFNGSGNIFRVTFNVTGIGETRLDLEAELWDYPPPDRWPEGSWPIEHVTIDGALNVIPEFSSALVLTFIMILAIIAIVFSKMSQRSRFLPL